MFKKQTARILVQNDIGPIKYVATGIALTSYAVATYFVLYGENPQSYIFLGIFGTLWLLIANINTQTVINISTQDVTHERRVFRVPFQTLQHSLSDFGAVLVEKRTVRAARTNATTGSEAVCTLVLKECVSYWKEAVKFKQAVRDDPTQPRMFTPPNRQCHTDKGLLVCDAPAKQATEVVRVAEECVRLSKLPLIDTINLVDQA